MKLAAFLKKLAADPRIAEVWVEAKERDEDEGNFWANLAPGWLSADGTTTLHETSMRDMLMALSMTTKAE